MNSESISKIAHREGLTESQVTSIINRYLLLTVVEAIFNGNSNCILGSVSVVDGKIVITKNSEEVNRLISNPNISEEIVDLISEISSEL